MASAVVPALTAAGLPTSSIVLLSLVLTQPAGHYSPIVDLRSLLPEDQARR